MPPPVLPPALPQAMPLPASATGAAIKRLALMYLGLLVVGAFSGPVMLGLLVTAGVVGCILLMIYKRTWGLAGIGCVVAPLLGALIGGYGARILDDARKHLGTNLGSPPGVSASGRVAGQGTIANSIGMNLVLIPSGEFLMGSPDSDLYDDQLADAEAHKHASGNYSFDSHNDFRPQHRVRITKALYVGVHPVTQAEYERVMGRNGFMERSAQDRSLLPMILVDWLEAAEFCRRLSALPEERASGHVYRLPTEAEWEYACRAGTTTRYCFGDDQRELNDYAWFKINAGNSPPTLWHTTSGPNAVCQKRPNAWGLYDMHGNVFEWCADWYAPDYYRHSPLNDPTGPSSGECRVLRGCASDAGPATARSADRGGAAPGTGSADRGFRVVMSVSPTNRLPVESQGEPSSADLLAPSAPVATDPGSKTTAPLPELRTGKDPRKSGGLIAFEASRGGRKDVYSMRPDGTCLRSLTDQLESASVPRWSPNGTRILCRGQFAGASGFYVINMDGGKMQKVLDRDEIAVDFPGAEPLGLNDSASWLPDSKTVAVCAGVWPKSSHVYLIDTESLERTTLTLAKAAWTPAWSPDGTRIVFETFNSPASFQLWLADRNGAIKLRFARAVFRLVPSGYRTARNSSL